MIGRQFSYYCCPEDLDEIEAKVFRPLGGRLLILNKVSRAHEISEVASFSLSRDRMGEESLFLSLAPPASMDYIRYSGPWVDEELSHLIQVGRSYIKDGKIHPARFWFSPKTYVNHAHIEKPLEYIKWAQTVFRKTKLLMSRHPIGNPYRHEEWFGKVAWQEVSNGKLSVSA